MTTSTTAPTKPPIPVPAQRYKVKIEFLTSLLGTAPSSPDIYTDFLIVKKLEVLLKRARTDEDKAAIEKIRGARADHELAQLLGDDESDIKGKTVFRANKGGICMPGYMVRGFYKEACAMCSSIPQPKSKIDKFLFVIEADIPLMRTDPNDPTASRQLQRSDTHDLSRPLRTEDSFGVSRTCLAISEELDPPVWIEYNIVVLPKGFVQKSDSGKFAKEDVKQWTEAGVFQGLGQWRSGGHGAFRVVSFSEEDITWAEAVALRTASLSTSPLDK
jgi:hypothetical protein